MKHRILTRNNLSNTNYHRTSTINKLRSIDRISLRLSNSYHTRHREGLNNAVPAYKWGLIIFHPHVHPHWTRNLLQLSGKNTNSLSFRGTYPTSNYRSCIHRVRTTLRTNIILGGYGNYKNNLSNPLYWKRRNPMTMGKFLCITTNPKPVLLFAFPHPLSLSRISYSALNYTTHNRIIKPHRKKPRLW